jgi:hypothetical protein
MRDPPGTATLASDKLQGHKRRVDKTECHIENTTSRAPTATVARSAKATQGNRPSSSLEEYEFSM